MSQMTGYFFPLFFTASLEFTASGVKLNLSKKFNKQLYLFLSVKIALTNSESAALKSVWQKATHSRSDIARLLQLSRPTASLLVKNLGA